LNSILAAWFGFKLVIKYYCLKITVSLVKEICLHFLLTLMFEMLVFVDLEMSSLLTALVVSLASEQLDLMEVGF